MTHIKEVYTITFGEQAENHKGMQMIGELAEEGFDLKDLKHGKKQFEKTKTKCELIDLTSTLKQSYKVIEDIEPAYVLVIRDGVNAILKNLNKTHEDLHKEQKIIDYDAEAIMYGRVVNKLARHNVCFDDIGQNPDIKNGKGRIIAFENAPLTNEIRMKLPDFLGDKAANLKGEGNFYYDITKCGIGFHGDAERMKVIAVRIGDANLPIQYQWFYKGKPVGKRILIDLYPGDMYVMSQKATGNDWKKRNIYTLRHATGADKYTIIKDKTNNLKKPKKT